MDIIINLINILVGYSYKISISKFIVFLKYEYKL